MSDTSASHTADSVGSVNVLIAGYEMKSVKLFLYIVLLAIDTTSSAADDFTGLVSGEGYSEDFGSAEPFLSCKLVMYQTFRHKCG